MILSIIQMLYAINAATKTVEAYQSLAELGFGRGALYSNRYQQYQ